MRGILVASTPLHTEKLQPRGPRRSFWLIGLVVVMGAGGLGYYLWTQSKFPLVETPLAPSQTLQGHRDVSIDTLAFYPDGNWLVSGRGAADIVVWDLATGKEINSLQDSVSEGGSEIYEDRMRRKREKRRPLEQLGMALAAAPAGLLPTLPPLCLKPEALEQALRKAPKPGEFGFAWRIFRHSGVFCVVDTANGPRVIGLTAAEFSWDKKYEEDSIEKEDKQDQGRVTVSRLAVTAHTVKRGETESSFMTWTHEGKAATARGFSPDGRWLLLVGRDGQLYLVENQLHAGGVQPQLRSLSFKNPGGQFNPLSLLPDGKRALVVGEAGALGVWDLETGQESRRLEGLQSTVNCFALSRDGRKLVTGDASNVVILWDVEAGKQIRRFEGHQGKVRGLAFSHDGARFLSDGEDKSLRIWDVEQGRLLWQLVYPEQAPKAMAFAPEGRKIAVACGKEIQVWELPR